MAGWSKLEGCKSFLNFESSYDSLRSEENELKSSFVELISVFIEENCSSKRFRPLPPMLGNGHSVDLLKLYFVVKFKGGFESVTRKKLWDEVGLLYGLGPGFGSAFKLIYLKYLDSLESWLVKLPSSESSKSDQFSSGAWSKGVLMALGSEYNSFVANMMDEMRKNDDSYCLKEEKSDISFIDLTEENNVDEKLNWNKFVREFDDDGDSAEENEESVKLKQEVEMNLVDGGVGFTGENHEETIKQTKSEMSYAGFISSDMSDDGRSSVGPVVADNVVKSSENSCDSKKCSTEDEELIMDSSVLKEVSSLKRKRGGLSSMLCWMAKVARNPTDMEVGTIPESFRWASYANDNCWKQVLLAREALFLKKSTQQSIYQKKQKMHPSMFDDERPRFSPRLLFEKLPTAPPFEPSSINLGRPRQRLEARLDMQPTASIYTSRPQQRIPIGSDFQAEVPEWTGVVAESDSKWLGIQNWPLEERENTLLIEEDSAGKGRVEKCGCLFSGTTACVKFHVARRRMEMKFELGSAFYTWKFDKMGEECSVSWTAEEEKIFKSVVKENPQSGQKCFWRQMCEVLPKKSWVDQVNYYFNVFVLQRRAFQNRNTPRNIDSDDDETEYHGSATNTVTRR
ncbi:AT-rich interactive domain-containing protein 1 isoform X1 [Beta vulgaris subsp. vulgaris]|uniref:AT-rich interactive domain-containing protein 1 isoform X1 n=2 Tax=Beta vulgaris subsp. vulgaris TaxID=3555 RepID=UPI0020373854|nr:AT-rich interactive domain-containing protein 1 isoform X1 [Beta vulgaris subsp. vulgaris]